MGKKSTSVGEILSVPGAAALLGLSERSVRAYAASKQLPAHRVGERAWSFMRSEIAGWKPPRGRGRPRKPS